MKINTDIADKFNPLFDLTDPKLFPAVDTVIITGGRYSLKSYTVAIWALIVLIQCGWNVLYTRFTNMSIIDSIKPELTDKIEMLGVGGFVTDTTNHIEYKGNRIAFKGIKPGSKQQSANLKSLSGFNCFINDEAEELPDFKTFKKIFYSIRETNKQNLSILILNPTTKDHWIFQEFFEKKGLEGGENCIKDNVMYIHTSYLDSTRLKMPANILADYERMKTDDPIEYENIGEWIDTGINGKSTLLGGSSGRACKAELLSRLADGEYLHTTYGPDGLNRTTAEFIYLLFTISNIPANAVNKSIRYDCDGNIYTQVNTPTYTIGTNKGIITMSSDRWDNFTSTYRFYLSSSGFSGSCPTFKFSNARLILMNLNNFSGGVPTFQFPAATQFRIENNNFTSNINNMTMPNLTLFMAFNNKLSGTLPNYNFPSVNTFQVYNNMLSGECPALLFPLIKDKTFFELSNNSFSSFESFLSGLYQNRALFSAIGTGFPGVNISGVNNAEPVVANSYPQDSITPSNGKEFIYKLVNDPDAEGFRVWDIQYNMASETESTPVMVVTFDDGFADNYTIAKPIFEARNKKMTIYVITSKIDTADYLTTAQITQLIADGHDIQCHTNSHTSMALLDAAQMDAEYESVNAVFSGNSWPTPHHTAYPVGYVNTTAKVEAAKYRLTGRKLLGVPFISNVDKFEIPAYVLGALKNDHTNVDLLKAVIDDIAECPKYTTLYGHNVFNDEDAGPGSLMGIQASYLEELLDYAITNGVELITISQLYTLLD